MVTFEDTVPSWLLPGQLSALSWATVHSGAELGSPTSPGGRWTVRFSTLSAALVPPPKLMLTLKLLLAPEVPFAGAALPETVNAAWALGAASRQPSATATAAVPPLLSGIVPPPTGSPYVGRP